MNELKAEVADNAVYTDKDGKEQDVDSEKLTIWNKDGSAEIKAEDLVSANKIAAYAEYEDAKSDEFTIEVVEESESPEEEQEKTPEEARQEAIAEAMSANKTADSVELIKTEGGKAFAISYNSIVPSKLAGFKPSFALKSSDFEKLGITVSVDGINGGKPFTPLKGKIVRKAGAEDKDSVSNASIVITKLCNTKGLDKDTKKAVKAFQKSTKTTPKKALGPISIRIYAFNLNNETAAELSGLTLKGKDGKYTLSFKLALGGKSKKQKISQKKDSFGNKNKGEWKISGNEIVVNTNDIKGHTDKFENKSK